jgi:hypothetical protein
VRFTAPVQLARGAGARPLVQRGLQPFLDEPLADALDGRRVQANLRRDRRVRGSGVGAEQHLRALVSPHRDGALVGHHPKLLPLLVGQVHDVLLVHGPVLHRPAPRHKPIQPL